MPFISSVSGALGGRVWPLSKASAPSVTVSTTTNFNQNRATFNGTVSANGAVTTTIKFQTSTDNSNWIDATGGTTISNTSSQNVSVFYNATNLANGTTYYVRLVATNSVGTTNSSSNSFTTWSLKTYLNTTAGSFSVSIPSVTPTGGSAIAPTIYEMLLYGAGGGANYGGGGGGGYRLFSSHTSSATGTQTVSGTVGAGGAAGNGGTGTGTATTGGSTTLTVGSTTWTGGGGTAGEHPGGCGEPYGRAGMAGTGTNPQYLGGFNTYGYYYIASYTFVCTGGYDKNGNCNEGYYQPNYAYDCNYYACGGGGGTDGAGGNAATQDTATHVGGNGGTGGGAYGLRGGNGGGGYGTQGSGSSGGFSYGSGPMVGSGGTGFDAGSAGGITFKYYGP